MAKNFKDLAAPLYEEPGSASQISEHKAEVSAQIVAYQLGELRRALGIDQVELAERLGISQAGVSKLERSADPKLSTLGKLSEAYGGTLRVEVEVNGHTYRLAGPSESKKAS